MKVVQVMPDFGIAGAEIMCENLIYELKKIDVEVVVVSLYDFHSSITKRLEENNIKIIYLEKRKGLDLKIIPKLIKVFKNEKPDVVHTHRYVMQYVIPAAIISKVRKRVHTFHSIATKENKKNTRKINNLFFRFNKVIPVALSDEVKKTIIEEYKLDSNKIPVIFNGINLNNCIEKSNYKIGEKYRVLHIGRFEEVKNHRNLILSFEKFHNNFPNSELYLIGDGEKINEIKNLVNEKNMNDYVFFLGLQKNVYPFLNKADTFILPSLYEGMPMTLIEAMGTGLPIIASNVGGIPDMLNNNKNALLINPDIESINKSLEKLISNETLRERLGKNAKKRAKSFSSKKMAESYLNIYKI